MSVCREWYPEMPVFNHSPFLFFRLAVQGKLWFDILDVQVSCGIQEGGTCMTAIIFRITLTHLRECTYNFGLSFSVISLCLRYGLNASMSYT